MRPPPREVIFPVKFLGVLSAADHAWMKERFVFYVGRKMKSIGGVHFPPCDYLHFYSGDLGFTIYVVNPRKPFDFVEQAIAVARQSLANPSTYEDTIAIRKILDLLEDK